MESKLVTKVYSLLPEGAPLVVAALTSLLIYIVASNFLAWRRLRHIPGPPLASFSSLWSFLTVGGGQCDINLAQAQEKYGKIMRIGPNAVSVYDPETLWQINSARSAYARTNWYSSLRFHPGGDSVVSETDTARHDKRKARLIGGFSGKGSVNLEADVDSQIAALVKYIRTKALDGQGDKIAFSKIIRWFQLDLITLAGLGEAWGDLADEADHFDFLGMMDTVMPWVHAICTTPFLRKLAFSRAFLTLTMPLVLNKTGLGTSIRQARSIVKTHFENPEAKPGRQHGSMLGEWIKHGHGADQCEWDLLVLMPAGTETTVTAIRGTLLHVLSSPSVYQKLKQEISEGIKAGRISRPITNDQAKAMPYLQAVIVEGMRMVPSVINGFAKKVPPGGDTICGKFVPEGTEIHANYVTMLMNREVFGADADVFRPERFLECDDKHRNYMLKSVELSFGYGRWLCLGKPLALIELNKIFVELLRVFDFQICHAEQPWKRKVYSASVISEFDLRIWENPLD